VDFRSADTYWSDATSVAFTVNGLLRQPPPIHENSRRPPPLLEFIENFSVTLYQLVRLYHCHRSDEAVFEQYSATRIEGPLIRDCSWFPV